GTCGSIWGLPRQRTAGKAPGHAGSGCPGLSHCYQSPTFRPPPTRLFPTRLLGDSAQTVGEGDVALFAGFHQPRGPVEDDARVLVIRVLVDRLVAPVAGGVRAAPGCFTVVRPAADDGLL